MAVLRAVLLGICAVLLGAHLDPLFLLYPSLLRERGMWSCTGHYSPAVPTASFLRCPSHLPSKKQHPTVNGQQQALVVLKCFVSSGCTLTPEASQ